MAIPATEVNLDRRAGRVVAFLTLDAQHALATAVRQSTSIRDLPQPYRRWLTDPTVIPAEALRIRFVDGAYERVVIDDAAVEFIFGD